MYEKIDNIEQMVQDYYLKNGVSDMVFDFLHINVEYTYVDLNSRLIDVNSVGLPVYNNGRRTKNELILIPVVLKKNDYNRLFSNDDDYLKRTFNVPKIIDAGTSYNFDYDAIYKQIGKIIPRECHIINDFEMNIIASINNYEKIFWDIQDENADILKDYELMPKWTTKVYGIKKLVIEEVSKKTY